MKEQIRILLQAKPMLPGTLEEHYNVCGKAQCRCKDKVNPQKHGPYYRLSYSLKGKNSSLFVKREDAPAVREMTDNYRESRSNIQHLALSLVDLYRQDGLQGMLDKYEEILDMETSIKNGAKPASRTLRETRSSCDKWKAKALERKLELDKMAVKIRDLEKSRAKWKGKAAEAKKEQQELTAAGEKNSVVSG